MRIPQCRRIAAALVAGTSLLLAGCDSSSSTEAKRLSSIAVSPTTASLAMGGTQPLTVSATYRDNSTAALTSGVTFTSSASTVATASATGLVTAPSAGTTTITATASGKSATALITVAPARSSIAVTHTASTRTTTRLITVTAPAATGSVVFSDAYDAGISFADFGGATNAVTIDATTLYNGKKSIQAIVAGSGGYSGGGKG